MATPAPAPAGMPRGREVLAAIFDGCEGLIELRALPSKARTHVAVTDLPRVLAFASAHAHENLYFGVATRRDASGGSLEHCQQLGALFVDVDGPDRTALDRFRLPPSIIIASGRDGGVHAYWLLKEPVNVQTELQRLRSLLRRLARAVGGDLVAAELARVLRLPAYRNHKYTPPRPIRIERFEPERRYTLDDLDDLLPDDPDEPVNATTPITFEAPIPEGQRNDTLYKKARALKWKQLSATEVRAALLVMNRERCQPALDAREVELIVQHAFEQPDRLMQPSTGVSGSVATPVWRRLSTVAAEEIEWLWPGRLALGELTLIMGDGGNGKSTCTRDLAARLTVGGSFPEGGAHFPRSAVVILTAEDHLGHTVRPSIEVHGGDPFLVAPLEAVRDARGERPFSLTTDLPALDAVIAEMDARLVVIDPLSAYFGTERDSYKDTDIRATLAPLQQLAARRRVALLGVCHIGKDADRAARHRLLGGIGFVNAARMVLAVGPDPDDESRRIVVSLQKNFRTPPSLAFRLIDTGRVARLAWDAAPISTRATADMVLAARASLHDEDDDAADALLRQLIDHEDWPLDANVALKAAHDNGISPRNFRRAKDRHRIESRKATYKKGWLWHLPDAPLSQREDSANPSTSPFAPSHTPKGRPAPSQSSKGQVAPSRFAQNAEQNGQFVEGAKTHSRTPTPFDPTRAFLPVEQTAEIARGTATLFDSDEPPATTRSRTESDELIAYSDEPSRRPV